MPKNTFSPKEPIDKLPLAVRKDIRDNYETKRGEFETEVATALKLSKFSFNFNANGMLAYGADNYTNAGYTLAGYAEGFVSAILTFSKNYGDEGIKEFNAAVSKSELTVNVDEVGDDAPTISARIQDGVFQILFHQERFGYNTSSLSEDEIISAIDVLPHEGLSLRAKNSIAKNWEPEYEELTESIAKMLALPDLKLDPNFGENYSKVLPVKKDDRYFNSSFGRATFDYFEGLKSKLEYDKIKDDDLIQEGIQEALGKKIVKLRVADTLQNGYYNGVSFEDGILYLETTPANWWVNVSNVADKLIDKL